MKNRSVLMEKMSLHTIDGQGIQEVTGGRTDQRKWRVIFKDVVLQFLKPASREETNGNDVLQVLKQPKKQTKNIKEQQHNTDQNGFPARVRNTRVLLHGFSLLSMECLKLALTMPGLVESFEGTKKRATLGASPDFCGISWNNFV